MDKNQFVATGYFKNNISPKRAPSMNPIIPDAHISKN